jgi:predicted ArsR family transcriptional regulator
MSVADKLLPYLRTRKTPVTAWDIAERMDCTTDTARAAMVALIKAGLVKDVLVSRNKRYVRGVLLK